MELVSAQKCFGGYNFRFRHQSTCTQCSMTFAVFIPPNSSDDGDIATDDVCERQEKKTKTEESPSSSRVVPVLIFLSGLTCTDENFLSKSGMQRAAASKGMAVLVPDTCVRG